LRQTSLVIVATTRSVWANGSRPGEVTASYGSFGSSNVGVNLATGRKRPGATSSSASVIEYGAIPRPAGVLTRCTTRATRRALFEPAIDYQRSATNSLRLKPGLYTLVFQTPNPTTASTPRRWVTLRGCDQQGPNGLPVRAADQRAQIQTENIAPSYTHVINPIDRSRTLDIFRRDSFNYYRAASRSPTEVRPTYSRRQCAATHSGQHRAGTATDDWRAAGNNIQGWHQLQRRRSQ